MYVTMHIEDGWWWVISYGLPKGHRPVRLPRTTRRHYAVLWAYAYGLSMGYLRVLCHGVARFTCGHPRGPCGFHRAWGHPYVQFCGKRTLRADTLRAWEYQYDRWCRALQGPVRLVSARSGYIHQAKHDYVTFDFRARKTTNWPSMGTNSFVGHVWKLYILNLRPGVPAQFKILRNIVRTRNACRVISHGFTQVLALTGPVDCLRALCDLGINYLMLRSNLWPTGVPQPVRLGEPYESVVRGKSIRNQSPAMQLSHAFSRFSVCSCDFWPSIACARKVPLRMQCGPVQTPYGLWNTLRPVLQNRIGANIGHVEPMDAFRRTLYGPKIVGSPSLKAVHAHLTATVYTAPYGSNRKTRSAVIRPVWSEFSLCA